MSKVATCKYLLTSLLFLLFHTTFLYGQNTISANQGYVVQEKYMTTIPYTEVKGKIIIEVIINNKSRKFILDTGASTVISENLYKELNSKRLGKVEVNDASDLKDSLNVVSISEIKLNEVVFKDIPALVSNDVRLFFDCFGVEGFIGSNLLRNSIIQFDSKSKTIILSDNPKSLNLKRKDSNEMELTHIQSNPFVWIKLRKGKSVANEKILFDTGDDGLYLMSINAYKHIISEKLDIIETLAESKGTFSAGLHGIAEKSNNFAINIPILDVNNLKLNNVTTRTTYAETSRFGSEILKYGKVTLDYKNKKFYIEPFVNSTEINLDKGIWAIDPVIENEKAVVGIIWDKTLEGKINVGDEILKFDDIDYQNLDFCEMVKSSNKIQKKSALLVLKDLKTGEIKKIEITKL
ncbi:gag-polyprotein putative aspartyl protease [Chryseobacterium taichungense]|uniref:Gag-polyprotein putative aspartyl protease n=1 Tax=Chryseobacterium taichungense TaxID=295069 RepID=A0A1H8A3X6_9FLAO|nr:retropepsin-like aspartic protease [Chryseobacterium taichungense]SEM65263.1 gag-polyprotein putative aspartyl protease [Chryseobacterium taichungense]